MCQMTNSKMQKYCIYISIVGTELKSSRYDFQSITPSPTNCPCLKCFHNIACVHLAVVLSSWVVHDRSGSCSQLKQMADHTTARNGVVSAGQCRGGIIIITCFFLSQHRSGEVRRAQIMTLIRTFTYLSKLVLRDSRVANTWTTTLTTTAALNMVV